MDSYAFCNLKLHPIQQIVHVIHTLHLTDSEPPPHLKTMAQLYEWTERAHHHQRNQKMYDNVNIGFNLDTNDRRGVQSGSEQIGRSPDVCGYVWPRFRESIEPAPSSHTDDSL